MKNNLQSKFQIAKEKYNQMSAEQKKALEDLTNIYGDYCQKEGKKPSVKGFRKFCKEIKKKLKEENDDEKTNNNSNEH